MPKQEFDLRVGRNHTTDFEFKLDGQDVIDILAVKFSLGAPGYDGNSGLPELTVVREIFDGGHIQGVADVVFTGACPHCGKEIPLPEEPS